jgi:shikimate kinase
MGSGKNTVGRLLAGKLGYRFLDLDSRIESASGKSIREIFEQEGEARFRKLESEALRGLRSEQRLVLATGGGAPMDPQNQKALRSYYLTFYLEVAFEESLSRTASDPARPLLRKSREELRALYESRLPVYEALGTRVRTDGRPPQEIAVQIMAVLEAP